MNAPTSPVDARQQNARSLLRWPPASTAAVAYAGLVTTTTNAKGQKAQETRNAIGQIYHGNVIVGRDLLETAVSGQTGPQGKQP